MTYSGDLLPAGRRLGLALDRVPVGAVIESLLSGSGLRTVIMGCARVVLAPVDKNDAAVVAAPAISRRTRLLGPILVTGSSQAVSQRSAAFAMEVVDGTTLFVYGVRTLGDAIDLATAGGGMRCNGMGKIATHYIGVRGASSFGMTVPKIYPDGIEIAKSELFTRIDPSRIARIEVIRGPQDAALYRAGAISGVLNVITRHDGPLGRSPQLQVSTLVGLTSSAHTAHDAFVQDHAASLRAGTASRNFGLGFGIGSTGSRTPDMGGIQVQADADGRLVWGSTVLTGTFRLADPWIGPSVFPTPISLESESQRGTELGADIQLRSGHELHVTRFDQVAFGLIQLVRSDQIGLFEGSPPERASSYSLQNIGAITNRDWELEGSARFRRLAVSSILSLVDSV